LVRPCVTKAATSCLRGLTQLAVGCPTLPTCLHFPLGRRPLRRTPFGRSSQSYSWTNFRPYEVALLDHHPLPTPLGIATPRAGCSGTHASASAPPASSLLPPAYTCESPRLPARSARLGRPPMSDRARHTSSGHHFVAMVPWLRSSRGSCLGNCSQGKDVVLSVLDLPGLITDSDLDGPAKAVGGRSNHQALPFERDLELRLAEPQR
jgi:hypothetical protein